MQPQSTPNQEPPQSTTKMQRGMPPKYIKGNQRGREPPWRKPKFIVAAVLLFGGGIMVHSIFYPTSAKADMPPPSPPAAAVKRTSDTSAPHMKGGSHVKCEPWDGAETLQTVVAPWGGGVVVRTFGSAGCRGVVMIHGANPTVVWEWERTARLLAQNGMRVLIPNLHSDPKTKPSAHGDEAVIQLLDLLAMQLHNESGRPDGSAQDLKRGQQNSGDIIMMGKSWGGGQALRYTAARPSVVHKIVLVAPMGGGDTPSIWRGRGPSGMEALLLYAQDDSTFAPTRAHKEPQLKSVLNKLQVHHIPTGGHTVSPEFDPVITSFVKHSQ
mmetsp:Transcript_18222/g.29108  ORF Transcript_18222/g.29108 Transcript_18222/m.29108 type:complete len:325 (+) Transcript_18222:63-1037(+)|eukprot:CAMPEP_0179440228 /NCGR_PEP_ID=MMETSP0799-20121207/23817_1 /TAXON_ID=46947 /ORGANISM="Geminigera cryophila, Strain CCMP2564" /LENGTH=324 /DNA_ID=CAMNT_0021223347 /DNA_START=51 /DNA_END=1025 /DNA_ORIENTATION=+